MKKTLKKPYERHEIVYQQMKKKGIRSWDLRDPKRRSEIEVVDRKFIYDILAKPWAPKKGKVLEIGCGTGPILRLVCKKGFSGLGIDISKTAITMAKEQSKGYNVKFKVADICTELLAKPETFDLVIDGHCLHCIIDAQERKKVLGNVFRLLKPGGLFIVLTMCLPIDRKALSNLFPQQRFINGIIYNPWEKAGEYQSSRIIAGKPFIATRYLGHWRKILTELQTAGFHLQQFQYLYPFKEEDIASGLGVAALVPQKKTTQTRG